METAIVKAACAIGAGIAIGFGAIGPAVGEGNAVGRHLFAGYRPVVTVRLLMDTIAEKERRNGS